MIDLDKIRLGVVRLIKENLNVPVIQTNQDEAPPKGDYISYSIPTLMKANNGTYGEYVEEIDGETVKVYRKEFQQIWSFTTISKDELRSKTLALQLYDLLDMLGSIELAEKEIVIQLIGNITNRDNLLTIGYEYRNGFDVTFAFMNEIIEGSIEEIETINLTHSSN